MTDTWPEAPYDPNGQLGCAQTYSAAVHWRGGARPFIPANLVGASLTAVSWDRRLNETSAAKVVLAKASISTDCCGLLGQIHPWCHELTLYRDGDLVWQGPISLVTEDQQSVTLDALDITSWLNRLVNTHSLNHPTIPVDITTIAYDVIRMNLVDGALATPTLDWPGMRSFLSVTPAGVAIKLNRSSIWSDTVLNIVSNLGNKGFEWTAVGRRMVLRPPATAATPARARLTPDDMPGGLQVTRDGTETATRVFATSQSDTEDGVTVSTAIAPDLAMCGRIDQLVHDTPRVDNGTPAQQAADVAEVLLAEAKAALAGRWPTPVGVTVQSGAQLSTTAPVTVAELVPGERIDVATVGYCQEVTMGMRLSQVTGTWGDSGEAIGVSLVPMADLAGVDA